MMQMMRGDQYEIAITLTDEENQPIFADIAVEPQRFTFPKPLSTHTKPRPCGLQ